MPLSENKGWIGILVTLMVRIESLGNFVQSDASFTKQNDERVYLPSFRLRIPRGLVQFAP